MPFKRIIQSIVLMLILTWAASCTAGKEYSNKLFTPSTPAVKDPPLLSLRFLELDKLILEKEGWVITDSIMGRDTGSLSLALEKLAKTFPAVPQIKDSSASEPAGTIPVIAGKSSPVAPGAEPVAKAGKPGEIRNKRLRDK